MTGVVIDVNARTGSAQVELRKINEQLRQVANNTSLLGKISFNNKQIAQTTHEVKSAQAAIQNLGKSGNLAFRTMVAPIRFVRDGLFSVKTAIFSVVTALSAIKSIGAFNAAADELVKAENKLRVMAKSTKDLAATQRSLYELSKESKVSYTESVGIYGSLARSLDKLGVSEENLLRTTKAIQQSMAISNMPMETMKAALLQLNQGLSSGTLRGEELNSVLEQMPALARLLTTEFKMSAGQLRKFAEEGNLTSEAVYKAIIKNTDKIEADFKRMSFTVQKSFDNLIDTLRYVFGELNRYLGSNVKWGRTFDNLSNSINSFADTFTARIFIVQGFIKSFKKSLEEFEVANIVVKAFKALSAGPLDPIQTFKRLTSALTLLNKLKERFDSLKTFEDKQKEGSIFTRITNFIGRSIDEKIDIELVKIRPPDEQIITKHKRSLKELLAFYTNAALDFVRIGVNLKPTFLAVFSNFKYLIPDIRGPVITMFSKAKRLAAEGFIRFEAYMTSLLRPTQRRLEGLTQFFSFYLKGDNELERAWVRLFNAKSVSEFADELENLKEAGESVRLFNKSLLVGDALAWFRGSIESARELVIGINAINQRLLFVNNIRFDRLKGAFDTLASIAKYTYQDILYPKFGPAIKAFMLQIEMYTNAYQEAFEDNISFESGEEFGRKLVNGFIAQLKRLYNYIVNFKFEFNTDENETIFSRMMDDLKTIFVRSFQFIGGTVKGVFLQVADYILYLFTKVINKVKELFRKIFSGSAVGDFFANLRDNFVEKQFTYKFKFDTTAFEDIAYVFRGMMIKLIDISKKLSTVVEKNIGGFGRRVKDIFFDIYDKVVGHSYWPDMITGIIDHTKRLATSLFDIKSYNYDVQRVFKDSTTQLTKAFDASPAVFNKLNGKLESIDWGAVFQGIGDRIIATLIGAIAIVFGNARVKIIAVDFILSSISQGLSTIFNTAPDLLASQLGRSLGLIAEQFGESFIRLINYIIRGLPNFVNSLLQQMGAVGSVISSILSVVPQNGLVYAILFGGAYTGFGALFKSAKSGIADLFGFASKKKKNAEAGLGAGLSLFADGLFARDTSKKKPKILDVILGPNPRLTLLSILTFSAAALESVSLLDTLPLGVPLLVSAILGPKTAGSTIRAFITRFVPDVFKSVYTLTKGLALRDAPKESPLFKLFGFTDSLGDRFKKKTTDAVKNSIPRSGISKVVSEMMARYSANIATYAADEKFSLKELFFKDQDSFNANTAMDMNFARFKRAFKAGIDSVLDYSFLGTSLRKASTLVRSVFSNIVTTMVDAFSEGGKGRAVITAVKTFAFRLGEAILVALSNIKVGISAFVAFISNKFVVFATLSTLIASVANAASGNVFSDLASSLGSVIKNIALATAGLYALGVATKAYRAGQAAKNVFGDAARAKATSLASTRILGDTAYDMAISAGLSKRKARKAKDKAIDTVGTEAFESAISSIEARKAGLDAIKNSLKESLSWLVRLGVAAKEFVTQKLFSIEWWRSVDLAVNDWLDGLMKGFIEARPFITEFVIAIGEGKGWSFFLENLKKARIGTLLWATTLGTLKGVLATLKFLLLGVGKAIGFLLLRLSPLLLIAGAAGAVGLVTTLLFGPGDSWKENLLWVGDKVKQIFSDSAPESRVGRFNDLKDLVKVKNVSFKQTDGSVESFSVDLQAKLDRLSLETLSESAYKIVKDVATTTQETIQNAKELQMKQGYLTTLQTEEVKKAINELNKIIDRQPKRKEDSFEGEYGKLQGTVNAPNITGLSKLDIFTEGALKKVYDGLNAVTDGYFESLQVKSDIIAKKLGGERDTFRQLRFNAYQEAAGTVSRGRSGLSSDQLGYIAKAEADLTDAYVKLQYAQSKGPRGQGLAAYNAEIERLTANFNKAEKYFINLSISLGTFGQEQARTDAWLETLDTLQKELKELADVDLGEKGSNFLGSFSDVNKLNGTLARIKAARKEYDRTGSVSAVFDRNRAIEEAKAIAEKIKSEGSFKTQLEFFIKVTGVEATERQLTALFAKNPEAAKDFQDISEKIFSAEQSLLSYRNAFKEYQTQLGNGVVPEINLQELATQYNAQLELIEKLRKKAQARLDNNDAIDSVINNIQKIGAESIDLTVLGNIGKDAFNKIKEATLVAKKAKEDYENVQLSTKNYEEQAKAIQEVSRSLREANNIIKAAKITNYFRVKSDPNATPGDVDEARKGIGGSDVPTSLARSSKLIAQWRHVDEQIAIERTALNQQSSEASYQDALERIRKLEKQRQRIELERAEETSALKLSRLSSVFSGFSLKDQLALPKELLNNVNKLSIELEGLRFNSENGFISDKDVARIAEIEDYFRRVGEHYNELNSMTHFSNRLSRINNAGFNIEAKDFNTLGDNLREIESISTALYEVDKYLNGFYGKISEISQKAFIDLQTQLKVRVSEINIDLEKANVRLDATGNISEVFTKFRDKLTKDQLDAFTARAKQIRLDTALNEGKTDVSDYLEGQRKIAEATRQLVTDIETAALGVATGSEALGIVLKDLKINIPDGSEYVDAVNIAFIRKIADNIRSMQDRLANDPTLDATARSILEIVISEQTKSLQKYLDKTVIKPEETKAYQAGTNFASSITSSFTDGLKGLLKGTTTVKEFLTSALDKFTSNVVDTFIDGMTSSLTKEGGPIDSLLKSLGVDVFQLGAGIFGGNGDPVIDTQVLAINNNTYAVNNLAAIMGGSPFFSPGRKIDFFSSGEKSYDTSEKSEGLKGTLDNAWTNFRGVLDTGWTKLNSVLSDAWRRLPTIFHDAWAGLQNILSQLPSLFSGLAGGGSGGSFLEGIGNAVSGAWDWLTSFFKDGGPVRAATGGLISGSGTSRSDSIPSMLSNGEYVINAASTKKYRPLLEAINNGTMSFFADGGVAGNAASSVSSGETAVVSAAALASIPDAFNVTAQNISNVDFKVQTLAEATEETFKSTGEAIQDGFKQTAINDQTIMEGVNRTFAQKDADQAKAAYKNIKKQGSGFGLLLGLLKVGLSVFSAFQSSFKIGDFKLPPSIGLLSTIDSTPGLKMPSVSSGLKLRAYATGGSIRGAGTGTSDSILAMVSNGEFIVNAKAASAYRPILDAINNGTSLEEFTKNIPKFAEGGGVDLSPLPTQGATSSLLGKTTASTTGTQVFNINVTGDISRQTRNEIQRMIPVITRGVNTKNRDDAYAY